MTIITEFKGICSGAGYRILGPDETIHKDDEWEMTDATDKYWTATHSDAGSTVADKRQRYRHLVYRRAHTTPPGPCTGDCIMTDGQWCDHCSDTGHARKAACGHHAKVPVVDYGLFCSNKVYCANHGWPRCAYHHASSCCDPIDPATRDADRARYHLKIKLALLRAAKRIMAEVTKYD